MPQRLTDTGPVPRDLDLASLSVLFRKGWSAETSSDPSKWTPQNPAWGQCAVTSAIIQDLMGGEVVWGEVRLPNGRRISHYWNRIGDAEIDMTRGQFPPGTLFPCAGRRHSDTADARAYVLSSTRTRERYERLRSALGLTDHPGSAED
jgi:hypothetical protein